MKTLKSNWTLAFLTAVVAILATLLVLDVTGRSGTAYGQVSEGGSANSIIGFLGEQTQDRRPFFLVDTKAQTIMIYEYFDTQRLLLLRQVRSYNEDRQISDVNFYNSSKIYDGPTVRDVRNYLNSGRLPSSTSTTTPNQPYGGTMPSPIMGR